MVETRFYKPLIGRFRSTNFKLIPNQYQQIIDNGNGRACKSKESHSEESFCYSEKWKLRFIFENDIGLQVSTSEDQNSYTKGISRWGQIKEGRQNCKKIRGKEIKVLLDSVWNMGKT